MSKDSATSVVVLACTINDFSAWVRMEFFATTAAISPAISLLRRSWLKGVLSSISGAGFEAFGAVTLGRTLDVSDICIFIVLWVVLFKRIPEFSC